MIVTKIFFFTSAKYFGYFGQFICKTYQHCALSTINALSPADHQAQELKKSFYKPHCGKQHYDPRWTASPIAALPFYVTRNGARSLVYWTTCMSSILAAHQWKTRLGSQTPT